VTAVATMASMAPSPAAYLQDALRARWRAAGQAGPMPLAVPLGLADVTGAADEHAAVRSAANVHLTADAVLVGPSGGDPAPACGCCLAIRWQRLRPACERDALEEGGPNVAVGGWPVPVDFVVDATWALLRTTARPTAPGDVARVVRLDLHTLRADTVELLPEPLCPAHRRTPGPPILRLVSRPRPSGVGRRLRTPDAYALPHGALANPVCGVLGPGSVEDLTAPTTAAVSGRFFERGRDGLNDIGWSGKADSFAASRSLGLLEGLERYAGTRPRHGRALVVDSLADLGDDALDPRRCGEYPPATYDLDPTLRRFSPTDRIPWVWGRSLRDDRPILVPARTAYYGLEQPCRRLRVRVLQRVRHRQLPGGGGALRAARARRAGRLPARLVLR